MAINPLPEDAFDFLEGIPDAASLVKGMLKAVVEHPDIHSNSFTIQNKGGGVYEYWLGRRSGQAGVIPIPQRLHSYLRDPLLHHGIAEKSREPNVGADNLGFTDAAIAWHKEYGGPTPDELRRKIGRSLWRKRQQPDDFTPEIKAEDIAQELNLPVPRVQEQIRHLLTSGRLKTEVRGTGMGFGILSFTHEGTMWAEQGFKPIWQDLSPIININVDIAVKLHIEVQTIINEATSAQIPAEQIQLLQRQLEAVSQELLKPGGEGQFQPVRELLSTAADSVTVLGFVLPWLVSHWDKIQSFTDILQTLPIL